MRPRYILFNGELKTAALPKKEHTHSDNGVCSFFDMYVVYRNFGDYVRGPF